MKTCKIYLSQGEKTIEIKIKKSTSAFVVAGLPVFWGSYESDEGNIPRDRQFWKFIVPKWELQLLDGGGKGVGMAGGGLKYGELESMDPAAILSGASFSEFGIRPIGSGGVGTGKIQNGMAMSIKFNSGPVSWGLKSYLVDNSNVFQDVN